MFIDYVSLLLVNMVAGLVLLAAYVVAGPETSEPKKWIPGFGLVGLIALVFGGHMTMTWPIIGPYNSMYGEMSVLLGGLFLGTAVALARGWSLMPLGVYAFFAGVAAVVIGVSIIHLRLTLMPALAGTGFILSGLGGIFAAPTLAWFKDNRKFRIAAAVVLLAAAAIWAMTVYMEYWLHPMMFKAWKPLTMLQEMPKGK
jgi:putative membrane protein